MAAAGRAGQTRQRVSVRRLGDVIQVRVSAGTDPTSGERIVLVESVPIERPGNDRSERAAWRDAEKVRTRLLGEADSLKVARTKSTSGALLDRWLPQHEVDPTTRMTYELLVRKHIRPVLGDVPLLLLTRDASERLERFYAELRRCRERCNGRPRVDHRVEGPHECRVVKHRRPPGRPPVGGYPPHDCAEAGSAVVECQPHKCQPYSASTVRQVNAIISGALSTAVRWDWIAYNPAPSVRLPAKPRPQPRPPSSVHMAQIVEAAYKASDNGTTTLRHYAAWVGAADKAAGNAIAGRMPKLGTAAEDYYGDAWAQRPAVCQ